MFLILNFGAYSTCQGEYFDPYTFICKHLHIPFCRHFAYSSSQSLKSPFPNFCPWLQIVLTILIVSATFIVSVNVGREKCNCWQLGQSNVSFVFILAKTMSVCYLIM